MKIGDKVSVNYFGHRFSGKITGFCTSGVTVSADVPFEKCGDIRDGVWMTFGEFYDSAKLLESCVPGSVEVKSFQGHTYGA